MTVIDGRANISAEVDQSEQELRRYVVKAVKALLDSPDFVEALPGFLPSGADERELSILHGKLSHIASIGIS